MTLNQTHRSHTGLHTGFLLGLYPNVQYNHFKNSVALSRKEAAVSAEQAKNYSKRKRAEEENLSTQNFLENCNMQKFFELPDSDMLSVYHEPFDIRSEIDSCLFDQDNHCTLFDFDEPMFLRNEYQFLQDGPDTAAKRAAKTNCPAATVPTQPMKKRCKLLPARPKVESNSHTLEQPNLSSKHRVVSAPAKEPRKKTGNRRFRERPFKNARERRRRAELKTKFRQIYNIVKIIASQESVEAKGLIVPTSGSEEDINAKDTKGGSPCKLEILDDTIKSLQILREKLCALRTRNKELKDIKSKSPANQECTKTSCK